MKGLVTWDPPGTCGVSHQTGPLEPIWYFSSSDGTILESNQFCNGAVSEEPTGYFVGSYSNYSRTSYFSKTDHILSEPGCIMRGFVLWSCPWIFQVITGNLLEIGGYFP